MKQQLSPEAAGQLLASLVPIRYAPVSLEEASYAAAGSLLKDFPELVATLPADWPVRLRAWLRINGPSGADIVADIHTLTGWMVSGLLTILDAGTVSPVISTRESKQDLDRLRKEVALYGLLPEPEAVQVEPPAVEPAGPSEQDLDDLAIREWRSASTSEVKRHMKVDQGFNDRIMRLMEENRI